MVHKGVPGYIKDSCIQQSGPLVLERIPCVEGINKWKKAELSDNRDQISARKCPEFLPVI